MKKAKWFFFLLLGFIFWNDSHATHLMGGNIGYDFVGTLPNGQKRYKIYLFVYRDCLNGQANFDDPLPLAIFDASTGICVQSLQVSFLSSNTRNVTPNISSNCPPNTLPSYCIEQGYYETTVDLPVSTQGYTVVYERCCRNNAILNVPISQGQTYTAFIPNTALNNSSPRFSDIPVPFMCVSDTVTLNNSATDRDGDSLVYSFVHPYAGGSTQNPTPQYNVGDLLNLPLPIQYNPNYSSTFPFGPTGYSFIDPQSGITYYYSTATGNYIVAVNINEYRNGVLISSTRRDIQFLVGNCPGNTPPRLTTTAPGPGQTNGSGQTNLTVVEGSLISFPITIRDVDSVYLSATGTLANPAANGIAQPYPTLTVTRGIGTVNGSFSWQTACAHRRNAPYEFTIAAQDQGCPKKTSYFNYRVTVLKSTSATGILGPNRLCEGTIDTFRTNGGDTSTYQWIISAGTILGGQGTNRLIVQMPAGGGSVQIRAIETSTVGCKGDTLFANFQVNAKPSSASQANPNPACPGDYVILQALQVSPQNKYSWTPTTNLINPNSPTAAFKAFNSSNNQIQRLIQLTVLDTITGCSDSSIIRFAVRPKIDVNAGNDTTVCPEVPFSIGQNFVSGIAYTWGEVGGTFTSTSANPTVSFTNNGNSNIQKTLFVSAFRSLDNCRTTDTIVITIRPKAIANAGPDIRICNNVSGTLGVAPIANHTYLWNPSTGLNDSTTARPTVQLINPSNTPIQAQYILTANRNGCLAFDTVVVTVLNKPAKPIIVGNKFPCKNSSGLVYSVQSPQPRSIYGWSIVGGNITQRSNTSITCSWGNLDTGYIIIQERDSIGCFGDPDSNLIIINRAKIDSLFGNPSVCPFIAGVQYWVNLDSGSTYLWSISGGSIASGQGTDTLSVNWGGPGNGWVKVIPTNKYGCVGDSVVKNVLKNQLLVTVPPVGDTDVCAGQDSTRYSVIPTTGSTYTWTVTNGIIISGQGSPSILVRWPNSVGTGQVSVLERSSFPCEGTPVSTRVNIHPLPNRLPILGPDTLCQKVAGSFQLNGYSSSYFVWWGTNIDSTTLLPRGLNSISGAWQKSGLQTLKVLEITNFGCTLDTLRKSVFVEPEPFIQPLSDTIICSGTSLLLGQSSEPNRMYRWSPARGLNDSTISSPVFNWINRNAVDDTFTIFRNIRNTITGCESFDTFKIQVHPLPRVYAGKDTSICTDFSLSLGEPAQLGYRYLWSPSSGLNNDTISNPILSINNPTDTLQNYPFILTATEPFFGCSWKDTVTIGIKPLPKPWAGPDREVCSDDTIQLGIGQQTNVSYQWFPITYLSNFSGPQSIYQRSNTSQLHFFDTVFVTATHQLFGCVKSDTVSIQVKPRPIVQAGPNVQICSGDSIGLGIVGNSQYSYQWTPSLGLSNSQISNPKFALINQTLNNQTLIYQLKAIFTAYQCPAVDTVEILLHPEPNTDSLRGPRLVCEYDSLSLYSLPLKVGSVYQFNVQGGTVISQLPGGQGWLIRWGRTGLGFINYQETDSNGCVGKWKNVSIQIAPRPFFKPILGDSIVCEPNITNVSYSVQNPIATSTYQWFIDGGRINQGQGTPSIFVDWYGVLTRKIGYVEINGYGCNGDTVWQNVYFDNLTIELNSISTQPSNPGLFELSWKVTSPLNLFRGQYQIYYRALGSGIWNIYGGVPYTQTKTTLDRLPTDQIYDFKVEALNNCNRLSSTPPHRNVVINGNPNGNKDLTLTWNTYQGWKDGVSAYELLKNKNEILSPDQSTYFGLDTTQKLEFLLDEYRVCYRILSHEKNGGNQSFSNRYCQDLEPVLTLPNAFTPDLNGLNDSFKAVGFAIKDFNLEIYNRWGERIFESNDINEGWDGSYRGNEAMEGLYIYLVRYSSGKGKTYLLKGNLSLIR